MSTELGGFVETSDDGTHFIGLESHAEGPRTEVNAPAMLIHGLGCNRYHWSRPIGWIAHSGQVVAIANALLPEKVNSLLANASWIPNDLVSQRQAP